MCFNAHVCGLQIRTQTILDQMVAGIPWIQNGPFVSFFMVRFWFVRVSPKYLDFVTKDLLAILMLWFCFAFCSRDMNMYLFFSSYASRTVSTLVATEKGKQRLQSLYSVMQCVVI